MSDILTDEMVERSADAYAAELRIGNGGMDAMRAALEASGLPEMVREYVATFDLMWDADMRAIKAWQAATGKNMAWPDRKKLTLWLLERAEDAERRLKEAHNAKEIINDAG